MCLGKVSRESPGKGVFCVCFLLKADGYIILVIGGVSPSRNRWGGGGVQVMGNEHRYPGSWGGWKSMKRMGKGGTNWGMLQVQVSYKPVETKNKKGPKENRVSLSHLNDTCLSPTLHFPCPRTHESIL